jgi:hypothetical protein
MLRLARSWALLTLVLLAAPASADSDAVSQRVAYLGEELAAAKSGQFYLVLDESRPAVDLKIEGVRVYSFLLDSAEFGQSRLAGEERRRWPAVAF